MLTDKAPHMPAHPQHYEVNDKGSIVRLKRATIENVEAFDALGKDPQDEKDTRAAWRVALERVKIVTELVEGEDIEWEQVDVSVVYCIHAHFFRISVPMRKQQLTYSET